VAPSAYQMCLRIADAQRALREGATPSNVAVALGFSDQSHFGRHFKRAVGMSPGEYARVEVLCPAASAGGKSERQRQG
jgi:AraC-like DNA-binding protein